MSVFAFATCYGSGNGCVPDSDLNVFLVIVCGGGAALFAYIGLRRWAVRYLMRRQRLADSEWSFEDNHAPPLNIDSWRPVWRIALAAGIVAVPIAAAFGDWYAGLNVLIALIGLTGAAPFMYRDRWIWRGLLRRN